MVSIGMLCMVEIRIFKILDLVPTIPNKGGVWPFDLTTGDQPHGGDKIERSGDNASSADITMMPSNSQKTAQSCRIEFDNVHFHYPMRLDVGVLNGFSLVVEPNQTVALVGSSGAGWLLAQLLITFTIIKQ